MKKSAIFLMAGIIVGCLIVTVIYMTAQDNSEEKVIYDTNYVGLVELGLAPSAEPRDILEGDTDTGVRMTDGRSNYALIKSGRFESGDYGKTFLYKVE